MYCGLVDSCGILFVLEVYDDGSDSDKYLRQPENIDVIYRG